jgi:putative PEP-CTERM system histidine kinase
MPVQAVVGSHAVAAFVFLVLSALLLGRWHARVHAGALAFACLLTSLWAASMAFRLAPALTEAMRTAGWLLLLLFVRQFPRRRAIALAIAIVGLSLASLAPQLVLLARLVLGMLGMLLVEQVFRLAPPAERWGIKFACIGIGSLFVFDFYLYSDALMFGRINDDISAARGIANALSAPLLAISVSRDPRWSGALAVSRSFMLHSATIVASALYLLAMAMSGYYLRYVGGGWGRLMQLVFLFGAAIVLAAVLFSGTLRARLKVWIAKHFFTEGFDYRQEWLSFTRVLSEDGPHLYERAIQALAGLVESPAGLLWLRKDDQWEATAKWNMPLPTETLPLDAPFCQFLEQRQWVIDVPDCAGKTERYGDLVLPPSLLKLENAWLLIPLTLHGKVTGFVVLAAPRAPIKLNWEVIDVLKIAGSQAASYLAHRASLDSLMVARQFESFNRMSTFIVHDLKNLACQFSLLLRNAETHRANPEFQADVLETLDHSVQKMQSLLQKLARGESQERPEPVCLDAVLVQATKCITLPCPTLAVDVSGLHVLAQGTRLQRVLGHLIQNAVDATPASGAVRVRLSSDDRHAVVEITDTGHGMTEEFIRDRLFRPFDSTKSAGMGIGVFESREYVRELGGRIAVSSTPGQGTTFSVYLPIHSIVEVNHGKEEVARDRG